MHQGQRHERSLEQERRNVCAQLGEGYQARRQRPTAQTRRMPAAAPEESSNTSVI